MRAAFVSVLALLAGRDCVRRWRGRRIGYVEDGVDEAYLTALLDHHEAVSPPWHGL